MRLKLERGDGARRTGNTAYLTKPPASVSEPSVDKVPRADHKSYPTRTIRLFDSKYVGIFNTHMECVAFVKGVEVVLDYMLKVKDVKSTKSLLNHMLEAKEKPAEPGRADLG